MTRHSCTIVHVYVYSWRMFLESETWENLVLLSIVSTSVSWEILSENSIRDGYKSYDNAIFWCRPIGGRFHEVSLFGWNLTGVVVRDYWTTNKATFFVFKEVQKQSKTDFPTIWYSSWVLDPEWDFCGEPKFGNLDTKKADELAKVVAKSLQICPILTSGIQVSLISVQRWPRTESNWIQEEGWGKLYAASV